MFIYFLLDDPWTLDSNGHSSSTTVPNDSWQGSTASGWQPSTASKVNPWSGNEQTTANNGTGLSINISDPWGLGATNSRPTMPTSPAPVSNTIDNELSDFFGASASKIFVAFSILYHSIFIAVSSPYEQQQQQQQQHTSSNPWNITSSSATHFPSSTMNTGSISPLNAGGNLLYPTIGSGSTSSPLPSLSASRKTPESFLGDKFSNLVNLDKLVTENRSTANLLFFSNFA
jgi:hypothetical protein